MPTFQYLINSSLIACYLQHSSFSCFRYEMITDIFDRDFVDTTINEGSN